MQSYNDQTGPNRVRPATKLYTSSAEEPVLLRIPTRGKAIETISPISIPGLLKRTASQFPNHPALTWKQADGKWHHFTYREYEEQVKTCAKAFLHLGLERHHSVCILGFNSPEWFISSLGAIYAGGLAAGIYTTNSSEACLYCAERGKANIIVVQDAHQLQKIKEIKDQLPHIKAIIQYEGVPADSDVLSWKQLMEIGEKQTDFQLNKVLAEIAINECCMLVFTSGTVGNPKAVMINHDNITWNALAIAERLGAERGNEHIISYLPLSHIAAQIVDIYICLTVAATVYFADKNALKGSLVNTLQEVRPTYFLGVPRVWEKIHDKIMSIGTKTGYIKKSIVNWAKFHSLQHNICKMKGLHSDKWSYTLAYWLVLKQIKKALGLDRCKNCVSAAAPLSCDVKKYFLSIDIPIMDAFGMSEASGAHTLSVHSAFNLESIGQTLPGMKTTIITENGQSTGEICLNGRHIFMGYLDEPEKTAEAIDEDGLLHSGDIGYVDENGFVYVTGRIKELLITAGGENVPPVPIEQALKAETPYISNAVLIGDKRKFLSMLVSLKTEVDTEGTPTSTLTKDVQQWLKNLGSPAKTIDELLASGPSHKLIEEIQNGINRVNAKATSNAQKIQKFAILPTDFSIQTGELGPTMKIKRNVVTTKYADIIEQLYN